MEPPVAPAAARCLYIYGLRFRAEVTAEGVRGRKAATKTIQ